MAPTGLAGRLRTLARHQCHTSLQILRATPRGDSGPGLRALSIPTAPSDELAIVTADRAFDGRRFGFGKLRAASFAEEVGHACHWSGRFIILRSPGESYLALTPQKPLTLDEVVVHTCRDSRSNAGIVRVLKF